MPTRSLATFGLAWLIVSSGHAATLAEAPLTPDELAQVRKAEALRIAAIEKAAPTVVCVFGNDRAGGGSGVLIDPSGLALTNHHVVAAAGPEGFGGLSDGKLYRWRIVGTDPGGDIAVIKLERNEPFHNTRIGNSDAVRVGDWALVMGNPFALADNYQPTVTLGIVSGVKRYQPGGGGKNQLIYGNCIQVDASINPGNSGGPLFNMQSQLIGINGRGSFQERGRVNVGLGYAVSMRQILNFLPDLLATKIVQHGTLDALFANRSGKVVCSTIDLDSAAARAGLELGDEVLSFDGEPIADANELTNLVTTLPAGWPVRLAFRRDGRERTIEVPLSPLPYALVQPDEETDPHQQPGERPGAGTHLLSSFTDDTDPPAPHPPRGPGGALGGVWSLAKAGNINHPELCQANARRILTQWQAASQALPLPADCIALRTSETLTRKGLPVGQLGGLFARDGRFRVESKLGDQTEMFGFDGQQFWSMQQGKPAEPMTIAQWIEQPLRVQALAIAAARNTELLTRGRTVTIDGGDRIGGRRAYRLQVKGEKESSFFVWMSLDVERDLTRHELLAVGNVPAPAGRGIQIVFTDLRPTVGFPLPWERAIVSDAARGADIVIKTQECRGETKLADNAFGIPKP